MTEVNARTRHALHSQQGAVLIVSLIFLVLLTLVGLASMQGSTMQERMAGNMYDRAIAFQRAEIALRAGENSLSNPIERASAVGHDRLDPPLIWDGTSSHGDVADGAGGFYIEPPTELRHPGGMDLTANECRLLFPVFAFATGGTDAAAVLIRSVFDSPLAGSVVCAQP
ncbi:MULTISPECIES: PilX N-terminal domain-containing pilus assembly protein [unclassified Ectothiorhodospira]|uniref:pilus assembly PilX family protein n=1 Tax=unclassified Ectothiorhodospira TaxID=2684909 RepID=UPI001EE8D5DF|nr:MULTISPECIES: PilX N-terminal domain-containing pilus assembly protein [unclassified Ectothiorhodospira]MCG5517020.1 PilX N-terminal domain-containing pilus assembly protein [Ectothiorhodospira sp. 9100]MCG5520024.1 PilX N-terminal domain-containing pilus assembly protein [Ectothiorhodospira sp. 9905]